MKETPLPTDRWLLFAFLLILFLGLLMLLTASAVISTHRTGSPTFYLLRQIIYGVLPGLFLYFIVAWISLDFLKKLSPLFLILGIGLLALVFLPPFSVKAGEAARWISLGPFTFQPSELAKLALIIYLAAFFEKKIKNQEVDKFKEGFLSFLFILAPFVLLLFFQPNMGTLIIFGLVGTTMFFAAGGNVFHIFFLALLGIVTIFIGSVIFPYQAQRVLTFLNPQEGIQKEAYQIQQSFIAIGSGGLLGRGFGNGVQKYFYLPQPMADTIFAVWAEETGLIGGVLIVFLYLMIAWRGIIISKRAPDNFSALLAIGVVAWFFLQAMAHIMAVLGLIPFTGIPLPFISYGGTAMIAALTGVGLLVNISRKAHA